MINGMQIAVHMPIFNVKVPDTAQLLVEKLVDVATFDLPGINVEALFGSEVLPDSNVTFYYPEGKKDLTRRLIPVGYGSHYIANVMGSIYIFMLLTIIGLILIVLLSVISKSVKIAQKAQSFLINFLCWNWVIRLIIQASLELSFAVILNKPFIS